MSNNDAGGADDDVGGNIRRKRTGISLPWDSFKSKYDILRNMYGSYKRLKNFTGVSADDNTGLIEMDSEWWDDREKRRIFGRQGSRPEAMYPTHMQDAKSAEQNENEPLDKYVPATQDNDGDGSNITRTTAVHLNSQTISLESPPKSPVGPQRSNRKQTRVAPYESNRGKDVSLSREKNIPRRRKSFEREINEQFKDMMEFRRVQVTEAKERREKNEAQPFKEAYGILQSIQSLTRWTYFWWSCIKVLKEDPFAREMISYSENDHDRITFLEGYTGYDRYGNFIGDRFKALQCGCGHPPKVNIEENIRKENVESHKEFGVPSNAELMSLFEEIGYKRDGGEQSQTIIDLDD
ncbi:hypothetical protein N665_0383s0169 [Sinapis alba]|nr:hypothetical protein N665_0383s0169 [Sinapis alba]